jgi:hypothetical protein
MLLRYLLDDVRTIRDSLQIKSHGDDADAAIEDKVRYEAGSFFVDRRVAYATPSIVENLAVCANQHSRAFGVNATFYSKPDALGRVFEACVHRASRNCKDQLTRCTAL